MTEKSVVIQGIRGGLKIFIPRNVGIKETIDTVTKKLTTGKPFFEGTKVNLTFVGENLNDDYQQKLMDTFSRYMDIGTAVFTDPDDEASDTVDEVDEKVQKKEASEGHTEIFDGIEEGMTRFVRGTVRNGQRIFYEGNIVVIGDVNPGGEIIAGGNILILGTIRGIAHAGATGNQKSVVAAYCLLPTQLRIANFIARAPEGEEIKPDCPEVAYIKDGNLIIEPYLMRKGK